MFGFQSDEPCFSVLASRNKPPPKKSQLNIKMPRSVVRRVCVVPHKCRSDRGHRLDGNCHLDHTLCPQTHSLLQKYNIRLSTTKTPKKKILIYKMQLMFAYQHTQGSTPRAH